MLSTSRIFTTDAPRLSSTVRTAQGWSIQGEAYGAIDTEHITDDEKGHSLFWIVPFTSLHTNRVSDEVTTEIETAAVDTNFPEHKIEVQRQKTEWLHIGG